MKVTTCCGSGTWWDHCTECGEYFPEMVDIEEDDRPVVDVGGEDPPDEDLQKMYEIYGDAYETVHIGPLELTGRSIGGTIGRWCDAAVDLVGEYKQLVEELIREH